MYAILWSAHTLGPAASSFFCGDISVGAAADLSRQEGGTLRLDRCGLTTQPQFTCRHGWKEGGVPIQDNRKTIHLATGFDPERCIRQTIRSTFVNDLAPV